MNIYEIAKLANTSISTVSRVLNNQPGVKADVRKKIEEIIEVNDYRPNLLARELTKQKTNVVGIIVPGINSYFTDRVEAINRVCRENGYNIMIASNSKMRNNVDKEVENLNLLYEKRVDGIIFFVSKLIDQHKEILAKITKKIPMVLVDQEIEDLSIPCVVQDNYRGAKAAMKYLVESGHQRIAFINGPEYDLTARQRYLAYCDVLQENGLVFDANYIGKGTFTLGSGYREMLKILEQAKELPTALFAVNDNMAIGAMKAIAEKELKVPDDISVVGFDDIEMASYFNPPLTTVHQNQYEIGLQAAELLLEFIKHKKVRIKKIIMDQELIIRGSTKKV